MQFIAKRLFAKSDNNAQASRPAIMVATLSVSLAVFVILISTAIVLGYQKEVEQKIFGFSSHLKVLNIHALQVPEAYPIQLPPYLEQKIASTPGVAHIQKVSAKKGVIKTYDQCSPITLKGLSSTHDTAFIKAALIEGRLPNTSKPANEIIISKQKANELNLKMGDRIYAYFFEQSIKTRRFTITGIYETHMKHFDATFALTDIQTVNQLNNWPTGKYCEMEINVNDETQATQIQEQIATALAGFPNIAVVSSRELYPQVFSWLSMLNVNAWVILVLMLGIAIFTMISGTFILILEQTQTIGTLSALGATQAQLQKLFFRIAARIAIKGVVAGNVVALGVWCIISCTDWFTLNPETYYLDRVPIDMALVPWFVTNIISIAIICASLLIPTLIIAYIQPSKVIRFE
jgi:lipoprotein-releasing system permease protein